MDIFTLTNRSDISIGEALNISLTGIVVVMLILALLAVLVLLLSKAIRAVEGTAKKKLQQKNAADKKQTTVVDKPAAVSGTALPESQSIGDLDLYDVDEKTAAVIMAIVSHESGIPLNRLQFKSIKAIEK